MCCGAGAASGTAPAGPAMELVGSDPWPTLCPRSDRRTVVGDNLLREEQGSPYCTTCSGPGRRRGKHRLPHNLLTTGSSRTPHGT